jgi:hypothetical protein
MQALDWWTEWAGFINPAPTTRGPVGWMARSEIQPTELRFLGGGLGEPFFETGPTFGFRPKSLSVIGPKSSK